MDDTRGGNPDGFCTEPCKGVGVLHPYHGVGAPPPDKDRRRLLLAYAIATYDTAHTSMIALMNAGVAVGYATPGAVRRKVWEFAHEWDATYNDRLLWNWDRLPEIVAQARAYCTEHQQEVDELEQGLTLTTERK